MRLVVILALAVVLSTSTVSATGSSVEVVKKGDKDCKDDKGKSKSPSKDDKDKDCKDDKGKSKSPSKDDKGK
jgi:hypothetical protein